MQLKHRVSHRDETFHTYWITRPGVALFSGPPPQRAQCLCMTFDLAEKAEGGPCIFCNVSQRLGTSF